MQQVVITIDLPALPFVLLAFLLLLALLGWGAYRYGYRSARRMRAALAKLPLGVVLFDSAGRPSFANSAAGMLLEQIDTATVEQARRAAMQGLQQTSIVRGNDGVVVQAQAHPLGERRVGVLLTLRDIGQQQRAEANYRKFIHTLSHELLTPFTSLQLRLANLDGSDEATRRQSLQVAREDVERLIRLTSNLLLLSRLESRQPLQRRPTNLSAVAEEAVLQLLEKADARRITLNVHAASPLARPAVDRDAWKQVFLNLIDNGIKYGATGGKVDVILRPDGPTLNIAVVDDGAGIAPDDLPHLFAEMFRADAHRHISGTGLGLTIVRRIVEEHGGRITCSSEPGRGTTFHISLPLGNQDVTNP